MSEIVAILINFFFLIVRSLIILSNRGRGHFVNINSIGLANTKALNLLVVMFK